MPECTHQTLCQGDDHVPLVLAARRLGLAPAGGRHFLLSTASLSALGYEHSLAKPVICLWDDTRHVESRN